MTEEEWLTRSYPAFLIRGLAGRASERQLRLFVCACCRRVWHLMSSEGRRAVEVAERYADGRALSAELDAARSAALQGAGDRHAARRVFAWVAARGAGPPELAASAADAIAYDRALHETNDPPEPAHSPDWGDAYGRELVRQAPLLRDIVGNPFRSSVLNPAWLTWDGGTIPRVAQAIYEERAFDRLPILADALEEAGCTDAELLGHLRGPGPHVRGCWAVDLLLGMA